MTDTVAVDTNVFTEQLRKSSKLAQLYAPHIVGRLLAITPQTVAETRFGALKAGWGPTRVTEVDQIVAQARVLPADRSTIEQAADAPATSAYRHYLVANRGSESEWPAPRDSVRSL